MARQTLDEGTIVTVKLLPGLVVAALAGQREIKIRVLKLSHKIADLIDRRRFLALRETDQIFFGCGADCLSEVCRRQSELRTRSRTAQLDRIDIRPTRAEVLSILRFRQRRGKARGGINQSLSIILAKSFGEQLRSSPLRTESVI